MNEPQKPKQVQQKPKQVQPKPVQPMQPLPIEPLPIEPAVPKSILTPPVPITPQDEVPPDMREFGDTRATRNSIYDGVLQAAQKMEPLSNGKHTLRLSNVRYIDPEKFTRRQQKQAILGGETLGRRMQGTWELMDDATGEVIDKRDQVVARVPFYTHRGTVINNGNEYTLKNQQRLLPGVFTRRKDNDEVETHFNILPGKGVSHRYTLDPAKSLFKIKLAQSEVPLLPLLRVMGATDKQLQDVWGPEILAANYKHDDPSVIKKIAARVLNFADRKDEPDDATTRQRLKARFESMETDPEVNRHTLGNYHSRVTLDTMLDATKKLLAVNRGESDPDDRDHLAYQSFVGPEDLFSERISRDHGKVRREILKKVGFAGNLSRMPSGALTRQLEQALLGSGLGSPLEEINPSEIFDKQSQVTRMGEGGIPDPSSIPDEARNVHSSQMGYLDPLRTPESMSAGIDLNMARNARKGKDGKIYTEYKDLKTGKPVWRSPQQILDSTIAFPGSLKSPDRYVQVMKGGKITYARKDQIDYELPIFENAFSPLGNMVPLKSMVKGQRVAMASRMLTQALSLENAEAPLVQNAMPGTKGARSFEEEYGRQMGAVHADKPGTVAAIKDGVVTLKFDDGTTDDVEMYDNHPFNRKSFIHQTALVKPGDRFEQGQTLVKSNYTNDKGATALGVNARVAYMPWEGYNFEDATVISESMQKKLTSQHAYQHELELDDKTRQGKKSYIQAFPSRFENKVLDTLDDEGVIKPGMTVEYGHPLVLATKERDRAANKIHKKRQAGFNDATITWDHHDPGVVTDVVRGKNGPVVLVRSTSQMQVGDKLCFDPETRILTRRGWVWVENVTRDDEVATLNSGSGELEWQKPTHTWAFDHDGPMYKLVTKHIDMLVTPDHKLWVARPGETYREITAQKFWESGGEWQFKKDCTWSGKEQTWYTFSDPPRKYQDRTEVLTRVNADDWLEFLGYYIAEGWSDSNYVKIAQFMTSPHTEKIASVLDRLGLTYRYSETDQRFEIGNVWLAEYLSPIGDSYTKRVPEFVQDLSPRQIRIFFDAYMNGDGHKGACWEFGTSSEMLMFDLQLLCMKLGWCVSAREVELKEGRWQRQPHWRGRVNRSHLRPWWKKGRAKQYASVEEGMVPYSGKVYCVTVPNHILFVERRNKSYWSLNSGRYG